MLVLGGILEMFTGDNAGAGMVGACIISWVHTCMKYNDLVYSIITKTLRVCIWSGSHVHSNLTVLRRK